MNKRRSENGGRKCQEEPVPWWRHQRYVPFFSLSFLMKNNFPSDSLFHLKPKQRKIIRVAKIHEFWQFRVKREMKILEVKSFSAFGVFFPPLQVKLKHFHSFALELVLLVSKHMVGKSFIFMQPPHASWHFLCVNRFLRENVASWKTNFDR